MQRNNEPLLTDYEIKNKILVYDVADTPFDHHTTKRTRSKSKIPYSSCSLIYEKYKDFLFPKFYQPIFEKEYIIPIDLHDNGIKENPFSIYIEKLNNKAEELEHHNKIFKEAVFLCEDAIKLSIEESVKMETDMKSLNLLVKNAKKSFLIAPKDIIMNICYNEFLINSKINFIISKTSRGVYIYPVNKKINYSIDFNNTFKIKIPEALKGKRNITYNGVNVNFCHKNGFLLVTDTIEEAIKLCDILEEGDNS